MEITNVNISKKYLQFIADNHAQGSGTASSYVTAINKLETALRGAKMLSAEQTLWYTGITSCLFLNSV